ncbi:MAG: aminotransferase, partial [Parcubacteria group bacterium]|nr:aminotransferase [Parcubacteria group bacterium]
CGWMEFYNRGSDESFDRFTRSLLDAKMLEVCSTTLPQAVLPSVMSDERYHPYLAERTAAYARRSTRATEILSAIPEITIYPAKGAFYMTAIFNEGTLSAAQTLPVTPEAQQVIDPCLTSAKLDQRFVYYLLASAGICVVPLSSGFNSDLNGFRFTLLEPDDAKFEQTIEKITESIRMYLIS